jgi:L-malate glycosyltransferase
VAIRVLHLASGDLWAGAEVQLHQLLCALVNYKQLQLTAIVLNPGELAKRIESLGIDVTILDESATSSAGILRLIARKIRACSPDILHTHRIKENILGSLATLASRHTTSVRTEHGSLEQPPTRLDIRRHALIALDRFVARHVQRKCVAVSSSLYDSLATRYGRDRVLVIRNGIDVARVIERANDSPPFLDPKRVHVAFVGRMVAVKRIDLLLRTARLLRDRYDTRFQFHLLGEGPLNAEMQQLAEELSLRDSCKFVGFVSNPLPYIRRMDALILTSDHEGTPMVALEALALGVPVVGPAVGGLTELLATHPEWLARTQVPEEYAMRLLTATAISAEARSRVGIPERYTMSECARQYLELYLTLKGEASETDSSC